MILLIHNLSRKQQQLINVISVITLKNYLLRVVTKQKKVLIPIQIKSILKSLSLIS